MATRSSQAWRSLTQDAGLHAEGAALFSIYPAVPCSRESDYRAVLALLRGLLVVGRPARPYPCPAAPCRPPARVRAARDTVAQRRSWPESLPASAAGPSAPAPRSNIDPFRSRPFSPPVSAWWESVWRLHSRRTASE